jgi:diadenosine tetraphosphatase ApaH/serine/threonine PP2A family protein phosphatase
VADSLRGRRTVLDPLRRAAGTEGARRYLDKAEPYRDVNVFLFEHGTRSPGIATPDDFQAVVRKHGATVYFDGLDPRRFPHDIGTLGRYGRVFDQLPRARHPWSPLPVEDALHGLTDAGLSVTNPS